MAPQETHAENVYSISESCICGETRACGEILRRTTGLRRTPALNPFQSLLKLPVRLKSKEIGKTRADMGSIPGSSRLVEFRHGCAMESDDPRKWVGKPS